MTISNFASLAKNSGYTPALYKETIGGVTTNVRAVRAKTDSSTFKTLPMYVTLDGGYVAVDTTTLTVYQLDAKAAFERLYVWYPDANVNVVPAAAGVTTTRYTATFDPTQTNYSIQQGASMITAVNTARFYFDLAKPTGVAPAQFITSGARSSRVLSKTDPISRHYDATLNDTFSTLFYGTNHASLWYSAAPTATDSGTIATSKGSLLSTTAFTITTLTGVVDLGAAATTVFTDAQLLAGGYGINSISASTNGISGYSDSLYQYYIIPSHDGNYSISGSSQTFDILKLVKTGSNALYYQTISLSELASDTTTSAAYNKILNTSPVNAVVSLNTAFPAYQSAYSAYVSNQQSATAQAAATSASKSADTAKAEASKADVEEDKAQAALTAAQAAQKAAEQARDSTNTTMWIAIAASLAISILAPFLVSWFMKQGMGGA